MKAQTMQAKLLCLTHYLQGRLYPRLIYLSCALVCAASLAIAILYMQDVLWLEPCPYCKLQRVVFFMMMVVFLLFAVINPKRIMAKISFMILSLVTLLGVFFALKHISVQLNPSTDSAASCQATTNSITEVLDFQLIKEILSAKGDCGTTDWALFGLSIPMLSLIAYVGLGLIGLIMLWLNRK
ncbi:hypothetical protein AwWohl_15080 [Gammaproteobacteria bacterium]|nr:hypothetical protein AwWohl_15080 [Gammaproteobacteria bacterium]